MSFFQGAPSPYYNESHRKLAKYLREFCNKTFAQDGQKWEELGFVPKEIYIKCAEVGFL